ncbi:calcium-activated chloride channel regulator 1-like [Haliotis rubra]|uniref:calcium-activated chloride channel regulator 1-like n=1 Tax=Haliotis rubra TaxID=36100 RepID=UPI001EE5C2B6|nr:calcium-activated chloride channel regulator 1-like [Haliotis rubra]XP_046578628.1 calcium-activated chloride channel regulator 1-like [Haliotis rubra]XP_046578629.1 calcium-activated chloride channel regulator 1-like [Haliotis rubra]
MKIWTALLGAVLIPGCLLLKISNNGYEDLVVAIHKDVPENHDILTNIQAIISGASSYLYRATRKRAYFRDVVIQIPETWTQNDTWRRSQKTFQQADVRIDNPHPLHGETPYTFQPGQCREPGLYVHFTPSYILDHGVNRMRNWGDPGRAFVHEFAHLRYGVFDEYGYPPDYPTWYLDGDVIRPTGCTTEIDGSFMQSYKPCDPRHNTKGCVFMATSNGNSNASVMYMPYLDSIHDFCETNAADPKLRHNGVANNEQNRRCNREGTWDIIRRHADFRAIDVPVDLDDVTPRFRLVCDKKETREGVRACGRRVVLLLNTSGSMRENYRFFKLTQFADKFIKDVLPLGSEVGVIAPFASAASNLTQMIYLSTDEVKANLTARLPKDEDDYIGGTAIGLGLLKAVELLSANGHSPEGGRIVLVVDGSETGDPHSASVLPDLVRASVTVHTVALGSAADTDLANVAAATGGMYSFYSEEDNSSALDSAAIRLLPDVSLCSETEMIELFSRGLTLTTSMPYFTDSVRIDSTVGNDTLFTFTLAANTDIEVNVSDPSGDTYDERSAEYSIDSELNIVRLRIPFAKPGRWTFTVQSRSVTGSSFESVIVVVRSLPMVNRRPYKIETWLNTMTANVTDRLPVVYTYVHIGYNPIIHASVQVTVDRSPQPSVTLILKDNGQVVDARANDGVYSAVFLEFTTNQRYSMQTSVSSVENQTLIMISGNSGAEAYSIFQNTSRPVRMEPAELFTRTASPGTVDVTGYDSSVDIFAPNDISDLLVVTSDAKAFTVTLNWTAPGGDLDKGTADRYELRLGSSLNQLSETFSTAQLIEEKDLQNSSLAPSSAGSEQRVVINVPRDWNYSAYSFGVIAIDDANLRSRVSNLQSVTFKQARVQGESKDKMPPGRITDLTLLHCDPVSKTFTLSWTAPGDDGYTGRVSRYEMRVGETILAMKTNYRSMHLVSKDEILNGSILPLPSGKEQRIAVSLNRNEPREIFVFAVQSYDQVDLPSELSNFLRVNVTEYSTALKVIEEKGEEDLSWIGLAEGLTAAAVISLFGIIIFVAVKWKIIGQKHVL